jgi:hypothetical protein
MGTISVEGHGRNGMAVRRWKTMNLAFGMIATTLSMQCVTSALARSTSQIPNIGGSNALKVALMLKKSYGAEWAKMSKEERGWIIECELDPKCKDKGNDGSPMQSRSVFPSAK